MPSRKLLSFRPKLPTTPKDEPSQAIPPKKPKACKRCYIRHLCCRRESFSGACTECTKGQFECEVNDISIPKNKRRKTKGTLAKEKPKDKNGGRDDSAEEFDDSDLAVIATLSPAQIADLQPLSKTEAKLVLLLTRLKQNPVDGG
ncbi:hypothetical protein ABW19_dt0207322 [Dactylella cylindrospora]|nr:hypothetical protein ABW19_dt0207322 [Dactylella cylindrospora]